MLPTSTEQRVLKEWNEQNNGSYIEVLVNNGGVRSDALMMWMEQKDLMGCRY